MYLFLTQNRDIELNIKRWKEQQEHNEYWIAKEQEAEAKRFAQERKVQSKLFAEELEARAKKEKEEADREAEKQVIFYEKFHQLLDSPDYVLIKQFARKHKDVKTERDYLRFKDELLKLNTLLAKKNWEFSEEELIKVLDESLLIENFMATKERILLNNPKTKEDYILSYLESFQADDIRNLLVLKVLLEEGDLIEVNENLEHSVLNIEKEIELKRFEKQLSEGTELFKLENIDQLTGYEFEEFLKSLFEKKGYQVEQTKLSGDQGADLVIVKFGEKTVIQAKRFGGKVGNKAVQEIMAAISLYQAQKGTVITNNYFTSAAVELANANNIELIDRDALEELINKHW